LYSYLYRIHRIHIQVGEYEYVLNISGYIQDFTFGVKPDHYLGSSTGELGGHRFETIKGSGSLISARNEPNG
jgi:hypothetical protein